MAGHPTGPTLKFRYRPELNGLRAIAVTAVVLFHSSTPGFAAGYLGVDVFFVLSGFLITSLLVVESKSRPSGTIDILGFYSSRVRRLLPASITVLLCTALAYRLAVDPLSCVESKTSFLSAAYYMANWAFIAADGDYWAEDNLVSPVRHYWSLAVEEQFYFGYPLLLTALMWINRRKADSVRSLLPFAGLAVCFISLFVATLLYDEGDSTALDMNTIARLYQLIGGAIVATVAPQCVLPTYVSTVSIVALVALLCSSGGLPSVLGGVASAIVTCCLILGMEGIPQKAADESWTKRFLSLKPMTFVGECSYSIYLVHFPLVIIGDAMQFLPSRYHWVYRTGVVLLASVGLGWLLRTVVELPSRRILLNTPFRKYAAVLCILVVPLLVTIPLMSVLSPTAQHANLVQPPVRHASFSVTESVAGPAGAPRFVSIGDSQCSTASKMMKALFTKNHLNGRSLCRASFPATCSPGHESEESYFRDVILTSLRDEPTDYLVVWNARIQFACVHMGKRCSFSRRLNDDVDSVRDLYEPNVLRFFDELLPFVNVAVIIMLPEPSAPHDPVKCLSENSDSSLCDWDVWHLPGYEEAVSAYEAVAEMSAARGGPAVLLFNNDDILCPNGSCHAVDHGILLFSNAYHVSEGTWARLLPEVERDWRRAGVSFLDAETVQMVEALKSTVVHKLIGDAEEEFKNVTTEYYEDLLPYIQRQTAPTYDEYVSFAIQFRQNRERAAAIRPSIGHISAALVAKQDQLVRKTARKRPDVLESIVIPIDVVDEQFSWALEKGFRRPEGPPRWPLLADQGCTEANLFCFNKAWLSLATALETDLICLWDATEGWAADIERLHEYDVLILLDHVLKDIYYVLDILNDIQFEGSVYLMPSESANLDRLQAIDFSGACAVILDNYWSVKDGLKVDGSFYPLWFKYPIEAWQALNPNPTDTDDPWLRQKAYVAMLTGRPSESERYVEERRAAADFFVEMGYSVNDETTRQRLDEYNAYFGRCKYAFLPMVERNSTGQIIADALASSNFTTLPFSYGHKLWMRALPPFLTVRNVSELRAKIKFLDSNEKEYRRLLEDVQKYAPAFLSQSLGETAAEMIAAVAVAPPGVFPRIDHRDCLRLPSLSNT